jgi:hypothetical protein
LKTVKDFSKQRIPFVAIDKSLDKLRDKVLFSDKLEQANKKLTNAKLPPKKLHS